MNLEREQVVQFGDRGVDTNPPFRWNRIDTSGVSSFGRSLEQKRIQEVCFNIHQEENKERREEENPQKQKTSGFEPFINDGENGKRNLLVNLYGGNFAQKMELNRKAVERVLKIAHLEGQVFLSSLSPNRHRSIEANPDGSVSGKGSLMLGEKIEDKKDNPLYKIAPILQGWRIEINDQKLTEELTEKEKLTGKELQRVFVKRFNEILRKSLKDCVSKEKLSSIKDKSYGVKLFFSILYDIYPSSTLIVSHRPLDFAYTIGAIAMTHAFLNILCLGLIRLRVATRRRNIDHPLEMFMPQVEVDKVARAFAYLQVKGRRLVRGTREENKNPE